MQISVIDIYHYLKSTYHKVTECLSNCRFSQFDFTFAYLTYLQRLQEMKTYHSFSIRKCWIFRFVGFSRNTTWKVVSPFSTLLVSNRTNPFVDRTYFENTTTNFRPDCPPWRSTTECLRLGLRPSRTCVLRRMGVTYLIDIACEITLLEIRKREWQSVLVSKNRVACLLFCTRLQSLSRYFWQL